MSADLILLDERDGRNAAEHAGLRVTGVLGVWLRAKNDGQRCALARFGQATFDCHSSARPTPTLSFSE
ncbi:MAG: hypothetical protein ABSF64_23860 [Bryobacteraceae bacterium]